MKEFFQDQIEATMANPNPFLTELLAENTLTMEHYGNMENTPLPSRLKQSLMLRDERITAWLKFLLLREHDWNASESDQESQNRYSHRAIPDKSRETEFDE